MRLVSIILFLFTVNSYAQTGSVQGVIQDKYGEPLWGSNVYLIGSTFGSSTDSTGSYKISNIPTGKYTIVCDYIGYRSSKKSIYISELNIESEVSSDASLYLNKRGLEEEVDDDVDIVKGHILKGVNFILLEDGFDS